MRGIHGLISALSIFLFIQQAQALTIDSFNEACGTADGVCQHTFVTSVGSSSESALITSSAIGGARRIFTTKTSGSLRTTDAIVLGNYSHSQDSNVKGNSSIVWDASADPGLHSNGFGGISLLQDGASAVVLKGLSYDLAGSLKLTFYDAADASGATSWSFTFNFQPGVAPVDPIVVLPNGDLLFPFSAFVPNSPGGAVRFDNVGAIVLEVIGTNSADLDFSLDLIGTNGVCSNDADVPNQQGRVIDECGACISQNPSLDNRACLDCRGVPNGPIAPDRCGVCDGDGNSCLECFDQDILVIQGNLDVLAKKQEAELKVVYSRILRTVGKTNPKVTATVEKWKAKAHALQIRNWIISWTFPTIETQCTNTVFCEAVSNQSLIDEYSAHSKELRGMMNEAVALLKKVLKVKTANFGESYFKQMDLIFNKAMSFLKKVPVSRSQCT